MQAQKEGTKKNSFNAKYSWLVIIAIVLGVAIIFIAVLFFKEEVLNAPSAASREECGCWITDSTGTAFYPNGVQGYVVSGCKGLLYCPLDDTCTVKMDPSNKGSAPLFGPMGTGVCGYG